MSSFKTIGPSFISILSKTNGVNVVIWNPKLSVKLMLLQYRKLPIMREATSKQYLKWLVSGFQNNWLVCFNELWGKIRATISLYHKTLDFQSKYHKSIFTGDALGRPRQSFGGVFFFPLLLRSHICKLTLSR